jgi:hypothetical protein
MTVMNQITLPMPMPMSVPMAISVAPRAAMALTTKSVLENSL